jgi:glycosyltransferase involved in cell wall biosynthesis
MPALQHKNILILSPQNWGKMFVSKHHYAIGLARQGNKVFFLDPPEQGASDLSSAIEIKPLPDAANLFLIRHKLWFPYILKFHAMPVFHAGMRWHVKKLLKAIGEPIDIIWSFDLGNLYPFRFFNGVERKIFHPVDEPLVPQAIESARGADVIFSVTTEILEKYKKFGIPTHFINHGVSENFLAQAQPGGANGEAVRIGFSGNLLRNDLDRDTFLQIVRENPAIRFECWGSYKDGHSNIGGAADNGTHAFVENLLALPNVTLHGPVPSDKLAREIHRMDGFLICYDIQKDQSKGTNYHKVMEFISTGKVIISNNVTTYKQQPDLVQMVESREDNRQLPALFRKITSELAYHNSPDLQIKRKSFARDNSYERQLERIEAILDTLFL